MQPPDKIPAALLEARKAPQPLWANYAREKASADIEAADGGAKPKPEWPMPPKGGGGGGGAKPKAKGKKPGGKGKGSSKPKARPSSESDNG